MPTSDGAPELPLPLTGMGQLALHSQLTFVPASVWRAAAALSAPPKAAPAGREGGGGGGEAEAGGRGGRGGTATAPQAVAPEQVRHPFNALVQGHRLGDACGSYLVSGLMQLPTARRQEVLNSLQSWASHSATAREAKNVKARLEHTLRTYVGLALPVTYAPFHPQDPAWPAFRALPFEARALLEHYLGPELLLAPPGISGLLRGVHKCQGLAEAEAMVAHFAGRQEGSEGLADVVAAGGVMDWAVEVTLDKGAGSGFKAKSLGPSPLCGSSTFMHRAVGHDRFLRVRIVNRRHWFSPAGAHALHVLAQQGLSFACRRYKYLTHKPEGDGICYFVAEESTGRESRTFKALTAHEAVARLGNFVAFPSVPRLVARVGLAFSRSHPLVLEPRQVELIDDHKAVNGGEIMTDGSGFIAADLAAWLPPHLFQGRPLPAPAPASPREGAGAGSRPFAVVQIRCICHLGGFKGTLLVHPELRGVVRLRRESMLKFPPPSPSVPPLAARGRVALDVLTAFRVLTATARLSRELVLILLDLGVPQRVFLRLCEDEVRELEASRRDRSQAMALLQRSSAVLIPGSSEWQAAAMLRAGHAPTEPHVARVLSSLRGRSLRKLQQGRLLCPGSLYVVGQPDPLGILKPDEVFVCHGLPNGHRGLPPPADRDGEEGVYEGRVLIARHPIHDPAHMRAFKAVRAPSLGAFLQDRAGVLFFSTKGRRSPASLLSNGDLDGDQFFVCLHPEIVAAVDTTGSTSIPVSGAVGPEDVAAAAVAEAAPAKTPPCPGSERLSQVGPFRFDDEPVGYRMDAALMRRCLESCLAQAKAMDIVAAASDWWIKHADARAAGSSSCRILGVIAARALDSAKTGQLWSLPVVLKPAHQPFYLQKGKVFDPTNPQHREQARRLAAAARSGSLLGQVHMRALPALEAEAALVSQAPRPGRELDPDLRADGAAAFLQLAQDWIQTYRRTFSRRMSRRAATGADDPGAFQAIRKEVVAPFRRLLQQAAAAAADSQGTGTAAGKAATNDRGREQGSKRPGDQSARTGTGKPGGEGVETAAAAAAAVAVARRPLQAITNGVPPTQDGDPNTSSGGERKAKRALASAVYEASYLSNCLAFPWDLALPELNELKEEAIAIARRRASQRQEGAGATAVDRPLK